MKSFPWARAMEIGFGHLKLAPEQFWRMTLPELAAAARCFRPQDDDMTTVRDLRLLMDRDGSQDENARR
jgi:uncharacterized phage protein (TIGR02216 family)